MSVTGSCLESSTRANCSQETFSLKIHNQTETTNEYARNLRIPVCPFSQIHDKQDNTDAKESKPRVTTDHQREEKKTETSLKVPSYLVLSFSFIIYAVKE